MPRAKILTIEDDAAIRRGIVDALRFAGYDVLQSGHGVEGTEMAVRQDYDLLLLDLVLPGRDGLEILRDVRGRRPTLPVIILSARGEEEDRVAGLKLGADDYVVKPFSVKELLARVEAVLRRSPQRPADVDASPCRAGGPTSPAARSRLRTAAASNCRSARANCCATWCATAGRAMSREELLENVWRISPRGLPTRTIDMHVARLREKLRDDPAEPRVLLTVRGKGYMFAAGGGAETP